MIFSKFAQILYPYLGGEMHPSEFVVELTTQIMEESFTNTDKDLENHPLAKKQKDTLTRIYNGKKQLSKKDARIIISHLDKDRFGGYLSHLKNDIIDLIIATMQESKELINADNFIDKCTDLFVSILEDRATQPNKKSSTRKKSTISQKYESKPERMSEIFNQNFKGFNIDGFINANPVNSLDSYLLEDTKTFINRIRKNQESENLIDKGEAIYETINKFIVILNDYFEYLINEMKVPITSIMAYREYVPSKDDIREFENTTLDFRGLLKTLYREISGDKLYRKYFHDN